MDTDDKQTDSGLSRTGANQAGGLSPGYLALTAFDNSGEIQRAAVKNPVWSHIEMRIDRAFQYGGRVMLEAGVPVPEHSDWFDVSQWLDMVAKQGRFRLIAVPPKYEDSRKKNLREWWEPEDSPFRGTERFGDDDWDARTVCTDISVAKKFFKEFFGHGGITDAILDQTLSVWERKPRT